MSAPIRSRLLTATPIEEWGLPFSAFRLPWIGLASDAGFSGRIKGVAAVTGNLDPNDNELTASSAGVATVSGELDATKGQVARTSAQIATHTATTPSAQTARTSAQIATHTADPSAVQVARVSVQVAYFLPPQEGESNGVATVTAWLYNDPKIKEVASSPNGIATVTGSIDAITNLSGQSNGVATTAALLTNTFMIELAGTSAGTSTVAGVVTAVAKLAATSAGVATASATLTVFDLISELVGSSAGSTTVVAGTMWDGPYTWDKSGFTQWGVPETVTEITVSAWGGGGGGAGGSDYGGSSLTAGGGDGAGGGFARTTLSVTPLEVLDIHVGGGGATTNDRNDGGGGGGFSAVKRSGSNLVIAGGGGGGGGGAASNDGGDGGPGGGLNGVDGFTNSDGEGGTGGGQAIGGLGGDGYYDGADGSVNQGGTGGKTDSTPRPAGGDQGGGDGGWGSPGGDWQKVGGGGGGGGIYGAGGGGSSKSNLIPKSGGGGGGGANTFTGTDQYGERGVGRAVGGSTEDGYPGSGHGWGGQGGLNMSGSFIGTPGVTGGVYIEWAIEWDPASNVNGTSTVSGTLDPLAFNHILEPLPWDLSIDAEGVHELEATSAGVASCGYRPLKLIHDDSVAIAGTSTCSGTLTNTERHITPDTVDGTSTVLATLQAGAAGEFYIELEGRSDGVGAVQSVWSLRTGDGIYQDRHLYQYVNVGVGFVMDTYTGGGGTVVSYNQPDGNPTTDWDRHLMQLVNVGVSFNDTDDVTTRTVGSIADNANPVAQTFSDGHIRDDWDRHLYQFLRVIEKVEDPGRLTIGPSPTRPTFLPPAKPPVSRVGRGPEVV